MPGIAQSSERETLLAVARKHPVQTIVFVVLDQYLDSHTGCFVMAKCLRYYRVGNLITDLIWMAITDLLARNNSTLLTVLLLHSKVSSV